MSAATRPLFDEAAKLGIGFHLGFTELAFDGDGTKHRFNTAIMVDKAGDVLGIAMARVQAALFMTGPARKFGRPRTGRRGNGDNRCAHLRLNWTRRVVFLGGFGGARRLMTPCSKSVSPSAASCQG